MLKRKIAELERKNEQLTNERNQARQQVTLTQSKPWVPAVANRAVNHSH
jgi:cell division protein FtsB